MKIKVFLFVLLIAALVLSSCGGGAAPEPAKPEEKPAAEQPQEAAKPEEKPAAEQPQEAAQPEEKPAAEQPQEAAAEQVELIINSWRNDDLLIWQDTIIPDSTSTTQT
jgi:outer membrane biosynthesis protein TonB